MSLMPFDAQHERTRQERIRGSEPRPAPAHPVRRESSSIEEDWLPAVVHSVNEATGELTFHLLDYADSPPVVGQYEYYGVEKTGYPRPPLTANAFSSQTATADDAVTTETPLVFAMRNRRRDWIVDLYNISETDAPSGIYVFGGSASTACKIDWFDQNDFYTPGSWTSKAPLVCPSRWLHAGVTVAGAVYAIGGSRTERDSLSVIDQYKPDAWTSRAPMPDPPRRHLAAFALNGRAYACAGSHWIGGAFGWEFLGDVDEYDPTTDTWAGRTPSQRRTPDSLDAPRRAATAFSLADAGYVCGGSTVNSELLRSTERYANDTWSFVADLQGAGRDAPAAFTIGDFGYVVGGQTSADGVISDIERYDPVGGLWASRGVLRAARDRHAASAIGEHGYVFGGVGTSGTELDDMQQYTDISESSRTVRLRMASPRRKNAAAATL